MASGRYRDGQGPVWGDQIGPNPTDRAKPGTKKRILVAAAGGPVSAVIAGANVHDTKLLAATLAAVIVARPQPTIEQPQHLCLDKADANRTGQTTVAAHGSIGHIRRIGEARWGPEQPRRYRARRGVVERARAWLCKCRAILVRSDKHAVNERGLLQLACALLWYRRCYRLRVLR